MVFGVTNSSRLAQYLVVSRRVVSPTLLNVVIVVPCKCLGGGLQLYSVAITVIFHPGFNHL